MPNDIFIRHGKRFYIKRVGICDYEEINFVWFNHRTFYKLTKDPELGALLPDKKIPRKEYFEETLLYAYIGWKNCFMEFFDALEGYKIFPTDKELKAAAKKLRLNKKAADIYILFYKHFFGK